MQEIFAKLQTLFNERPVWTRVKLASILGINTKNILLLKALPYIGYAFKCGPFRSCVIRFGFDPRKDYANRIYQVINLRLPGMGARVRNDIQICDIENPDPALERLLTSLLFCKPDFDSRDGFFVEGHLAKVKEHLAQRAKDTEVVDASENVNAAQDELLNEFEDMDDFDLLFE